MSSELKAGVSYFAVVFAVGFVLGALRVLVLLPRFGATASVMLELPILLAFSWPVASALRRAFAVPASIGAGVVMGATAFALLMVAEMGLAVFVFGRSLAQHVAAYGLVPEQLGLLGQIAFGMIPVVQAWLGSARPAGG